MTTVEASGASGASGALPDLVSRLINLLAEEREDFTSVEIAETLWLAMQIEPAAEVQHEELVSDSTESSSTVVSDSKSDTPSKAGGLMNVTAPRAGVLAEGVCESIRIVHFGQTLPALGYNDARPPLQIQRLRRHSPVPRNSPPQNCVACL